MSEQLLSHDEKVYPRDGPSDSGSSEGDEEKDPDDKKKKNLIIGGFAVLGFLGFIFVLSKFFGGGGGEDHASTSTTGPSNEFFRLSKLAFEYTNEYRREKGLKALELKI